MSTPHPLSTLVPAGQTLPPVPPPAPTPVIDATLNSLQTSVTALGNDVRVWRGISALLAVTTLWLGVDSWLKGRAVHKHLGLARQHAAEAERHRTSLATIRRLAE